MSASSALAAPWRRVAFVLGVLALAVIGAVLFPRDPAGATGNTIASPDTAGNVGPFTSLALDAWGNPVVSYYDYGNSGLKVLHCGDPTCTAGNIIASPDTEGDVGRDTSLALDAAGNPVVSYRDWTTFADADLKVLHCGNPTCTSGNTVAAPDTAGDVGYSTSLALDGSGNPVVSYQAELIGDLKVLRCGNPTCTGGNTITSPDTVGSVGAHTSLALDAAGNPVVSYQDGTNGDLKVLHCGNPTCTAGNTIASPDTVGWVGGWTSLALNASGNPVVSYVDGDPNYDLKVLRCGNPTCTSGNTIAAPDTEGDLFWHTSLRLDSSGNPVVSYFDDANDDLKVLHCGNPTCTAGNTVSSPDTGGWVGNFSSLALDASGYPVVSYYDNTNFDLKVLHCGSATCKGTKVGGISVDPGQGALPLHEPGSSGSNAGALAGIAAGVTAGAIALGGAAWWVRRRRA